MAQYKITMNTIVATDSGVDARAAADACNKELMAQGETGSLAAAEAQISSCAECLRGALQIVTEIVTEEVEHDEADKA